MIIVSNMVNYNEGGFDKDKLEDNIYYLLQSVFQETDDDGIEGNSDVEGVDYKYPVYFANDPANTVEYLSNQDCYILVRADDMEDVGTCHTILLEGSDEIIQRHDYELIVDVEANGPKAYSNMLKLKRGFRKYGFRMLLREVGGFLEDTNVRKNPIILGGMSEEVATYSFTLSINVDEIDTPDLIDSIGIHGNLFDINTTYNPEGDWIKPEYFTFNPLLDWIEPTTLSAEDISPYDPSLDWIITHELEEQDILPYDPSLDWIITSELEEGDVIHGGNFGPADMFAITTQNPLRSYGFAKDFSGNGNEPIGVYTTTDDMRLFLVHEIDWAGSELAYQIGLFVSGNPSIVVGQTSVDITLDGVTYTLTAGGNTGSPEFFLDLRTVENSTTEELAVVKGLYDSMKAFADTGSTQLMELSFSDVYEIFPTYSPVLLDDMVGPQDRYDTSTGFTFYGADLEYGPSAGTILNTPDITAIGIQLLDAANVGVMFAIIGSSTVPTVANTTELSITIGGEEYTMFASIDANVGEQVPYLVIGSAGDPAMYAAFKDNLITPYFINKIGEDVTFEYELPT